MKPERTPLAPDAFVAQIGEIFAVFDASTQDSGNVSYGVQVGPDKVFVKTAGSPHDNRPFLSHDDRVALLRNAIRLARAVSDAAIPTLRHVVESGEGPLLIYDWAEGELVGTPALRRADPTSAFARFLALPALERAAALDVVFRLHERLAEQGWIASDFYDGCLLYDFGTRTMHVVDLDNYRDAPFTNQMGRMFGSTRFMAPEEHTLGARIDERTTVFTMGRTVEQFMAPDALDSLAPLVARACHSSPDSRFRSVADFYSSWSALLIRTL